MAEARVTQPCAHRWRIDTPYGPQVRGECLLCGAVRLYTVYLDDAGYNSRAVSATRRRTMRNLAFGASGERVLWAE